MKCVVVCNKKCAQNTQIYIQLDVLNKRVHYLYDFFGLSLCFQSSTLYGGSRLHRDLNWLSHEAKQFRKPCTRERYMLGHGSLVTSDKEVKMHRYGEHK